MAANQGLTRPIGGRRSDRILWPVPIRVTGTDSQGIAFAEETVTVSVNQHGARISLTHSLSPGNIILIRNQTNGIEEGFRVIPGGEQVFGDRWEWRVEATRPNSRIWGIEFNPPVEDTQPKVLIECDACKNMAYSALTSMEYGLLLNLGVISHHCTTCGQTTRWKPSVEPKGAVGAIRTVKLAPPGSMARKARRVDLAMRVHIRNQRGVEDAVQTRDVSKTGLCFVSSRDFKVGDVVAIDIPFSDRPGPSEAKGKILWSTQGSLGRVHGVNYIDENK
jgi:hypothetical protein